MQSKDERSRIIKMMVVGCQLADYAMRELVDGTKHDLKQRVNRVIKAAKSVEDYFYFHPTTTPEIKEAFEREFLKSETVLLAELMVTTWNLDEKDLEMIIDKIKANIE